MKRRFVLLILGMLITQYLNANEPHPAAPVLVLQLALVQAAMQQPHIELPPKEKDNRQLLKQQRIKEINCQCKKQKQKKANQVRKASGR